MKLPRIILIFIFASPTLNLFYYGLKRTNKDIWKSILLAIYLVFSRRGLNSPSELDRHQPNPQLIVKVRSKTVQSLRFHSSYVSGLDKIEQPLPKHYVSDHSESVIKTVRAGSRGTNITNIAAALIGIWILRHSYGFQDFQPVRQVPPPENMRRIAKFPCSRPDRLKSDGKSKFYSSNLNEISTNPTEISTDLLPTQTQVAQFQKNGKVDLKRAFEEVNRRAEVIGCENFDCSFERFKNLAQECGECKPETVREAITILEGEMRGFYKNARRGDYGPNVKSLNFEIEGVGKYSHLSHAEVKGLTSSSIQKKISLNQQARNAVRRTDFQKRFWSNQTEVSVSERIPNLKPDANLPESPNNVLGIYDLWDVGTPEKPIVSDAIMRFSKNDTNIVILNKDRNT